MNEFYTDAAYFSRRCIALLHPKMEKNAVYDSVLYFAFCIERLFKGVLWDIEPRMVLENDKEENCFAVIHRHALLTSVAENIDKSLKGEKPNHNTITFKEAMLKAKNFSQVTHDNIGVLMKLSDYRGVLAHRVLSLFHENEARRFVLRYFQPIVGGLLQERRLDEQSFFGNDGSRIAEYASTIEQEDNFADKMEALLDTHRQIWAERKDNNVFIDKAARLTAITEKDKRHSEYSHHLTSCPACKNDAFARFEADWEVEGSSGEGWFTGVYAAGFSCEYCDLTLDEYEQFDYFKLNDLVGNE